MFQVAHQIATDPFQLKETTEAFTADKLYANVCSLNQIMMKLSGVSLEESSFFQHSRANHQDLPTNETSRQQHTDKDLLLDTLGPCHRADAQRRIIFTNRPGQVPCKIISFMWRLVNDKLFSKLLNAFLCYMTLKLMLTAAISFRHDIIIKTMKPKLTGNSSPYSSVLETCVARTNITYLLDENEMEAQENRLDEARDIMSLLGCLVVVNPGVGTVSSSIICCLPVLFYYMSLVLFRHSQQLRQGIRVDYFAFLFCPREQRRRVFAEIDKIILELVQTTIYRIARSSKLAASTCYHRRAYANEFVSTTMERRHRTLGSDRRFLEQLNEIHDLRLVQPIIFTSSWHGRLVRFTKFMVIFGLVCASAGPWSGQMFVCGFDLIERTRLRLKQMYCERGSGYKSSLLMWDQMRIPKIGQDSILYETYDGSVGAFLYLAFWVESKYYFSYGRLLYMIECPLIFLLIGIWSSYWANIFITSSGEKAAWLKQVRGQMKACINNLEMLASIQKLDTTSEKAIEDYGSSDNVLAAETITVQHDELQAILKGITISYINFELYRKQSPRFQHLNNFMILQMAGLAALAYVVSYFVATSIDTRYQLMIIYSLTAIGSVFNFYLLLSSYRLKLVEKLMHDSHKLLAHSAGFVSLSASYPIELWRRQLLNEADCRLNFSSRLFLLYVSWETLISFNIYLFALWLILLK